MWRSNAFCPQLQTRTCMYMLNVHVCIYIQKPIKNTLSFRNKKFGSTNTKQDELKILLTFQ